MSVKTNGERLLELARDLSCGLMEADEQRELGRLLYDAALWTGNPLRKLSPAGALCDTQTVDRALAASQPVGEPVAVVTTSERFTYGKLNRDLPDGTNLYAAPPAQAVDLGAVREAVRKAWQKCAAGESVDLQFGTLLALIDSMAVGNG